MVLRRIVRGGNSSLDTGKFIDSPVKGLHYKTASQDGYTNEKGEFKYKAGEQVEFILGKDLSLGKVAAKSLITPYTMANVPVGTDNNKATNIALLLQNLDYDKSDDIIDVSRLKDFPFVDYNLGVIPSDMQTKIQDKFTADTFDEYLKDKDDDVISVSKAKENMDSSVNKAIKEAINPRKLIGKTFKFIENKGIFGLEDELTFTFNPSMTISGYEDGQKFEGKYEFLENNVIKATFDENDIEYSRIVYMDENIVKICEDEDLEKTKKCKDDKINYWVNPKISGSFIKKHQVSSKILDKKVKITSLDEISNKYLYQLKGLSANRTSYEKEIIRIENGKLNRYFNLLEEKNLDKLNPYYTFDVSFENENIHISGNYGFEDMDYPIYKYDLTNKEISLKDLGSEKIFDDRGLMSDSTGKSINFASGNMYCSVLWWECWFDEIAMNQLIKQVK